MNNPYGFKINPKFKHFNFTRDHLPTVVKDSLDKVDLNVVEIGVEYGGYLDVYYPQLETVTANFYCVDLWKTDGNDDYFRERDGQVERGHKRVIERYGNNPKVNLCQGPSVQWAAKFEDEYFDWIYIDADHTKEAVLEDIKAWYPKVKKGGIISGHDCFCEPTNDAYDFFDVEGAVEEYFSDVLEDVYLTSEASYKSWCYIKPE
jgi:cephalosporin hydroxylase